MKTYENNNEQVEGEQQGSAELESSQNTERMTDLGEIEARELEIVNEYPDVVGYNIDSKLIINPQRHALAIEVNEVLKRDDAEEIKGLEESFEQPVERIREAIDEELSKDGHLDRILEELSKTKEPKLRVHPFGPSSPFSIDKAVFRDENGDIVAHIDDGAMDQIQKIREKIGENDLVVVMNPFHRDAEGKGTSNIPDSSAEYIALCEAFVEQSGYGGQGGKGLVLELGNECNICEKHGDQFKDGAFAESVEPDKYAKLYFETAKDLKSKYPDLKISLAGTAFYDKKWVEAVVGEIQGRKKDEGVNQKLIDIISIHPYRDTANGTTSEVFGDELGESTEADFDAQLDALRAIAAPMEAEVTVGEISFYNEKFGESVNEDEQVDNAKHGREKGYTSYIWPGDQIVKYENSN